MAMVHPGVEALARWLWRRRGLCLPALCLASTLASGAPMAHEPARPASMPPGTELRVADAKTGGLGYWTLYLPADFSEDRKWPVIFCFHGLDQKPGTWPFRQLTGGRGYIMVGMEYLQRGLHGIRRAEEAVNLQRVVALVKQWLPVDERALFVGGFSKGGWHTSNMAERTSSLWRGAVILGAGRSSTPDALGLRGKPVFIGIGEHDMERAAAAAAADFYGKLGARVTFATFKGKGHTVDIDDPALRRWLQEGAAQRPATAAVYGSDLQQRKPR